MGLHDPGDLGDNRDDDRVPELLISLRVGNRDLEFLISGVEPHQARTLARGQAAGALPLAT